MSKNALLVNVTYKKYKYKYWQSKGKPLAIEPENFNMA